MAKVINIKSHKVTPMDSYFFDNNIWVFLFAPIAESNLSKQKIYSNLLSEIQSRKATIFISSLIVSEFVNFCLKQSFKQWKEETKNWGANYKRDYIPTQHYKDAVEDVKFNVEAIMKITEPRPDDFNALDLNVIFSNTGSGDFNDCYYAEQCIRNQLKIVTDDKDFRKISNDRLEVITII